MQISGEVSIGVKSQTKDLGRPCGPKVMQMNIARNNGTAALLWNLAEMELTNLKQTRVAFSET